MKLDTIVLTRSAKKRINVLCTASGTLVASEPVAGGVLRIFVEGAELEPVQSEALLRVTRAALRQGTVTSIETDEADLKRWLRENRKALSE